jgi:hypothetical protein
MSLLSKLGSQLLATSAPSVRTQPKGQLRDRTATTQAAACKKRKMIYCPRPKLYAEGYQLVKLPRMPGPKLPQQVLRTVTLPATLCTPQKHHKDKRLMSLLHHPPCSCTQTRLCTQT